MMNPNSPLFAIGNRVAYGARFLRSIAAYTGPMPFRRGTVTAVESFGADQLVTIAWDGEATPSRVIAPNLTLIEHLARDAAL